MNLKKIIKEEMDWVSDVESSLPDSSFLSKPVPVTITLRDYLNTEYSYNFIDIILENGNVIELTMEGDWDVKYNTYNSPWELVKTQSLSDPWASEEVPTEFTQDVMEEYLREFNMEEVNSQVDKVLRKMLPLLDIKGIYVGDL